MPYRLCLMNVPFAIHMRAPHLSEIALVLTLHNHISSNSMFMLCIVCPFVIILSPGRSVQLAVYGDSFLVDFSRPKVRSDVVLTTAVDIRYCESRLR